MPTPIIQPVLTPIIHINALPKGWHKDPAYADHVFIGRRSYALDHPGTFGNLFVIGQKYPEYGIVAATNDDVVRLFETYQLLPRLATDLDFRTSVQALFGKTLVCYCKSYVKPGEKRTLGHDQPCHGDVLAHYACQLEQEAPQHRHG